MMKTDKTNKYHPTISFNIIEFDIWDRNPNARSEYEEASEGVPEIMREFIRILRHIVPKHGYKVESDGDRVQEVLV